ncbi:hypothetical protein [Pseudoponticoccus marisrubri]|uniref:SnoaL-like domain-containing protein n=1 Tax=Pseudoponticoccus marisrubri TaxID=1685382 RepID=A0A0W7WKZ5_9RHOB|nr:hypothetical protein [Pseudoponticoccus marisrubri]KUF11241.1 hypothetical protein AVJ23_09340 [Pseudoponticoccus marisrubri]
MTEVPFDQSTFERFLEDISEPFMTGDITRWRRRILLPFSLITQTGPVTLDSDAAVETNFHLYLEARDAMQLDLVSRVPLGFERCDDNSVIATYKTDLLRRGTRVVPPYTASALLHHRDGRWKMSAILNALGHHHWTGLHPYLKGAKT